MADFPHRADLLQLWGVIGRAVRDPDLQVGRGRVMQNIFNTYQQSYLAAGEAPPRLTIFEVNQLRSLAARQYRAERALQRSINLEAQTGLAQGLTVEHFAPDLDTRPGAGFAFPSSYRVRFQINTEQLGQEFSRYVTWDRADIAGLSTSQLLDRLAEVARGFGEDYGEEFTGLGDYYSITYV